MLYFATGNMQKFEEVSQILQEYGIALEKYPMELEEIDSNSAKEIALHKARQAFAELKQPVIVEDSGTYFEAFKDFPGTMSKRIYNCIGFEGLLKLLERKKRGVYFMSTICFMESENQFRFFEGKWKGKVTEKVFKPKSKRMAYEKIVVPEGFKKPLVEIPLSEKNKASHRAQATRALGQWLKEKALNDLIDSI
jgi:non-canonical purine NTP pyrophosphatase (RdgB/HAM1 family)